MINKLNSCFHYCTFINPEYLKGEIAKHLEIPEENIRLTKVREETDDNGNVRFAIYSLEVDKESFTIRFDKKTREVETIQVPKVVKKPKKWYQTEDELAVVVEEKKSAAKPMDYWLLSNIEEVRSK